MSESANYNLGFSELVEALDVMSVRAQKPVMIWGGPGIGKCPQVGTPVMKADGTVVPVETVKVGDQLMGPDSTARNVLSVGYGTDDLFAIIPRKGDPWVCSSDHILTLTRSPQWPNDPWAGSMRNVPLQMYLGLRKNSKHHLKQFRVPVDFGNEIIPLPIPPYLLGALLGDGGLANNSVRFTNKDPEILAHVSSQAASMGVNLVPHNDDGQGIHYGLTTEQYKSNNLLDLLRSLGLAGTRSGNKFIPHQYKVGTRYDRLELLAGLIDTDGHLQHTTYEYTSKSKQLADDVAFVARSLGFLVTQKIKVVNDVGYHRLHISGNGSEIPCRTPRKQAPERKQRSDVLRTGFSVEYAGRGQYYGFELDGDNRFLLGDFTVTHNSDATRELAGRYNMTHIDIRPSNMDPVEIRGLQYIHEHRTTNAVPDFLPPSDAPGRYLIVLEELVSAMPAMQVAMYQLVLDRRIGEYRLPDGAVVVACGNRESDRGVVYRMPAPLANRFCHLELEPDPKEWAAWGARAGIESEVLFYIGEFMPNALYEFEPKSKEHAFPTPRSWAAVSNFLAARRGSGLSADLELKILKGTVGEARAIEFGAFLRMWREVPHPQAVFDDPLGVKLPEKPDVQIALCGSLYQQATGINFPSIIKFAGRLRPELGEFLVGSCCKANDNLMYSDAYIQHWACKGNV